MAYLDHAAAYEDLKAHVLSGIQETFPIKGTLQTVQLHGLHVKDADFDADDIKSQHEAKMAGKTWAATVYGDVSLSDTKTGKVISRRTMRLAELPMVTRRRSFIVDGKEYQVDNQWQLKPGVYAKRRVSGELEAAFNIPDSKNFDITFNPASKKFLMERGGSKVIPVYPILKTLGVDDDALEKAWGKDILQANKDVKGSGGVEKFFRADKGRLPSNKEEAEKYLLESMERSVLRPDSTKVTLGTSYTHVTGDTIRQATAKLLSIQGGAPEDDRDSLLHKDLRTAGDFAYDKIMNYRNQGSVRRKAVRQMFSATDVRDLIKFDMFNEPIRQAFSKNQAAHVAPQINPVEMIAAAQQTTVMGPGGIQSHNAVDNMVGLKYMNSSHMGFLDPVRTPESENSGVVLRLPMGVSKRGKEPVIPLYNLKTGKTELVTPTKFAESVVILPDQVDWKSGRPVPKYARVKAARSGNDVGEIHFKDADYAMRHSSQLFSVTTNLIPFLGNNSGNRATYAGQHMEQAISLRDREAPLVQVGTGSDEPGIQAFEGLIGRQAAHQATMDGKVVAIKDNTIVIEGKGGKKNVQLYNNFPLNDHKSVLHSTPIVKVGDHVKAGQVVADTNFTDKGSLALGANLRVAYIPYKGYNFEDGVVISESAAKKLTSEHLQKPELTLERDAVTNPRRFLVHHPDLFNQAQIKKLDDDGVVRIGQRVEPGDPLALAMRPFQVRDRMNLQAIGRALSGRHTDVSLRWQSDYPGEVVSVHKESGKVVVHVRTLEPMQVGDKLAGRHGNKGIVTKIIPDHEMPHTADGKHIEVALNPSGVPGRMNLGQVLETAAGKIAQKTGKPYIVDNFSGEDQLSKVKGELKKHGLTDQEVLHDPTTGLTIGKALVGPQHILKLMQQVDEKYSARSGMNLPLPGEEPESYDNTLMPAKGGKSGGQAIGHLDLYTLLAHGAKANIREMQTWKSEGSDPQPDTAKRWPSQHSTIWNAIQTGGLLSPPKSTFAFQKFTDMLRANGVNVIKNGNELKLLPMTDKQILAMSSGEIPKPGEMTYSSIDPKTGEHKPKPGGLFDEKITGGHGGRKWSHITLAEAIPNPVFEGPIQRIMGMSEKDYLSVVQGRKSLSKSGKITDLGTAGSMTGGPAIVHMLGSIDVQKELAATEKELAGTNIPTEFAHRASTPKIDKLVKKVKYLRALDQAGLKPADAYTLKHLPVIPPAMRPGSVLKGGAALWGDLNKLYQNFGITNMSLKDPSQKKLGDEQKIDLRTSLYDGVRALMGVDTHKEDGLKGVLHQIAGNPVKSGYFQNVLMSRRQDLSMSSTIVPDPSLGLDEVGLPKDRALTLYKPFVIRKLVEIGAAPHVLEARKMVQDGHPQVEKALRLVASERPVLLKRDPSLHRHSIQAFKPVLVSGQAIQIHPLVTTGYNADFDGDTMRAYVPISDEAVREARLMMPSHNLYNEASGRVIYSPTLESALGLYKLGRTGTDTGKRFKTPAEVLQAVNAGKLDINDLLHVGGLKTTAGRILLASALPEPMQKKMLETHTPIDKKGLGELFKALAEQHRGDYGDVANRLKDLGNGAAYGAIPIFHGLKGASAISLAERPKDLKFVSIPTHSLSLDDFEPDRATRDRVLGAAQSKVDDIRKMTLSNKEKERREVETWITASNKMDAEHMKKIDKNPSNLALMLKAGVKPSDTQYKQMVLASVLMSDAAGNPINTPIKKSYSEGLDLASYWVQQQGARRGTVMKVQEVRDPGTFTKRMIQTTMNQLVVSNDCGTTRGIAMNVADKNIHDRRLATDVNIRDLMIPAGTLLTPEIIDRVRAADKHAMLVVRSPLKCEHAKGICQMCAGLRPMGDSYPIGTNLGILASQALGERSVQLTMKQFHSGGIVQSAGASRAVNDFERVLQLTNLTEKIPNAATLSMRAGKIEKVEKDPTGVVVWVGGVPHHVGKDRSGVALNEKLPHAHTLSDYKAWAPPKVGMTVRAGQSLSDPNRTVVNPRDLYRATNDMETVQNFLVDELHSIYGDDVRRQHIETVVKSMGDLTKIRDPGDAPGLLHGEFQSASVVRALNRDLIKQGKRPIEHSPVLKGVDQMPLAVQEDWLAKLQHINLKDTLLEAAAMGGKSNIHGVHPVPGIAYGAEFGLTSKDSLKPGHGHLKDVPTYAY